MPKPLKIIEVVANPYIAIDADGVPQGVVSIPGSPRNHIGAHRDHHASRATGKHRFWFTGKTVKVHLSRMIVNAVNEGSLIAADVESARVCGISKDAFVAPDEQLKKEREKALTGRQAHLGKDATISDPPMTPAEDPGAAAPAPSANVALSPNVTLKTP